MSYLRLLPGLGVVILVTERRRGLILWNYKLLRSDVKIEKPEKIIANWKQF